MLRLALPAALLLAAPLVHAQTPSPVCQTPQHRAFDFFLGDWDGYLTDTETLIGRAEVRIEDRGCVITEYWEMADGSRTGRGLHVYDLVTGQWEHFWADSDGDRTYYVGGIVGRSIRMVARGDRSPQRSTPVDLRVTFSPNPDGTVRQLGEYSTDGATWQVGYDLTFRPQRPR